MRNHKLLFFITIFFFALGFVNIHFSLLGIVCMTLPIILLLKDRKKTWCQGYCPRASLYTNCGKTKKWNSRKTPQFFIKGNMKWIMLAYFGVSLFFIIMSTLGVARDIRPAMETLRFLILIPLPFKMPQLFDIIDLAPWLTHLSYRFYSMMMTTTFLGLILAMVYKPRTWCTICPIATVSDVILKK
ncbi:MAG: putative rane protein [Neobacillus sp.]|jgi:hypothetical protein|nr:putative rane protein [Neobacillus sp.]